MGKYLVVMPIAGTVEVEVEADDEAGALQAAWDSFDEETPDATWEYHEKIVEGNVCSVMCTEVEITEIKETQ